jgi:hypothetical protein
MQIIETRSKYELYIEENAIEILKHIDIGTGLPIFPKFRKYLQRTFELYNVKALILKKKLQKDLFREFSDEIEGITIIFNEDSETLFFGFFGVYDHDRYKIDLMVKNLISFANENDFLMIRGPINIPAVIFGFGFMEEGSCKEPYVGCPINPPLYQEIFYKNGFFKKYVEDTYRMAAFKFDPRKLKRYDFSEYEVRFPGKEGLDDVIENMIDLHSEVMPDYSNITTNTAKNVQTHFDYIFDFGEEWMVWTLYHKPTGKMVGCGHAAPNPLSTDKRGRYDTARFLHWVLHPDHQKKGLAIFMYGETSLKTFKNTSRTKIKYGTGPFGVDNKANIGFAKNITMGKRTRRHIIIEKILNK